MKATIYFTASLFVLLVAKIIFATDSGATVNDALEALPGISLLEIGSWLLFSVCIAWYPDTYGNWRVSHGGSRETRMVDDGQGRLRQQISESQWTNSGFENARLKFWVLQATLMISGIAVVIIAF